MENLLNYFTSGPVVQRCFCPIDKMQDLQDYRSQFNFFDYYTKCTGYTTEQLEEVNISVKDLEESCQTFIINNLHQDIHESHVFDHFEKIVPEPNTDHPTRVRATVIISKLMEEKSEKVAFEMYFVRLISTWTCVGGEKI
jgi:hypothetical protein